MTREEAIELIGRMSMAFVPTDQYGDCADPEPYETAVNMAIEALSAEAKGDLISRHWLLDLYATPEDGDDVEWKVPLEVVRQNILDAPSADTDMSEYCDRLWKIAYERGKAEAVQGWIPCSERLPEKDGNYLVCMSWNYHSMDVLKWADGWNCFRVYDDKINRESEIDGTNIIAWMPLPEPYKGGEADEID